MQQPNGYIMLSRSITTSEIYRKHIAVRAILEYLIFGVNYQDAKPNNRLPRGTGYFTWPKAKSDLKGVSQSQWWRALKYFEDKGTIEIDKTPHGCTIHLVNYATYQTAGTYKKTAKVVKVVTETEIQNYIIEGKDIQSWKTRPDSKINVLESLGKLMKKIETKSGKAAVEKVRESLGI